MGDTIPGLDIPRRLIVAEIGTRQAANVSADASTHSLQVLSYEHHEIHAGSHFNYCDYALNQATDVVIDHVITTPNTDKLVHLVFSAKSTQGATLEIYEGATGISGGDAITPRNNNRSSSNASIVTLLQNPTITNDGTRAAGFVLGDRGQVGIADRDQEYVLAKNTSYLARITSLANSNNIGWCAEWYEHTDKD